MTRSPLRRPWPESPSAGAAARQSGPGWQRCDSGFSRRPAGTGCTARQVPWPSFRTLGVASAPTIRNHFRVCIVEPAEDQVTTNNNTSSSETRSPKQVGLESSCSSLLRLLLQLAAAAILCHEKKCHFQFCGFTLGSPPGKKKKKENTNTLATRTPFTEQIRKFFFHVEFSSFKNRSPNCTTEKSTNFNFLKFP